MNASARTETGAWSIHSQREKGETIGTPTNQLFSNHLAIGRRIILRVYDACNGSSSTHERLSVGGNPLRLAWQAFVANRPSFEFLWGKRSQARASRTVELRDLAQHGHCPVPFSEGFENSG